MVSANISKPAGELNLHGNRKKLLQMLGHFMGFTTAEMKFCLLRLQKGLVF